MVPAFVRQLKWPKDLSQNILKRCLNSVPNGIRNDPKFNLVSELDNVKRPKKIKQKLEANKQPVESKAITGLLEQEGQTIADILNDSLLMRPGKEFGFQGVIDVSKFLEIQTVKVVGDGTQLVALWDSLHLRTFVLSVRSKYGLEDATKLSHKISTQITDKLQRKEARFRTDLLKKMDFKRVPRIKFKVKTAWIDEIFGSESKSDF